MVTTLNDLLYQTREFWLTDGPPEEMFSGVGEFLAMLAKVKETDWRGDGTGLLPVFDKLPANVGANYAKAYNTGGSSGGKQFVIPAREHHAFARFDGRFMELLRSSSATIGSTNGPDWELIATTTSFMRSLSYLVWGDGTGRIAKGDGSYDVATDTVIFKNTASSQQFEVDDIVVLIAEGAAVPSGGMPTPRAGTLTVTAVADNAITLSAAVNTIAGAVNTDFISKDSFFGSDHGLIDGVFRQLPITQADAGTTLFTVDRSTNVNRLSGRRVKIEKGMSPYEIVGKLAVIVKKAIGAAIKASSQHCVFVPAAELEQLMSQVGSQKWEVRSVQSRTDVGSLCMGVELVEVAWPGLGRIKIASDHFLHDPTLSDEEDRTYAVLDLAKWRIKCGATGFDWKQYEDNGGRVKHGAAGSNEYYAEYGAQAFNLFCDQIGHQALASTRS